jgi:hypothetical protein
MRESLMYGSVRGARGNSRPYRDTWGHGDGRTLHGVSCIRTNAMRRTPLTGPSRWSRYHVPMSPRPSISRSEYNNIVTHTKKGDNNPLWIVGGVIVSGLVIWAAVAAARSGSVPSNEAASQTAPEYISALYTIGSRGAVADDNDIERFAHGHQKLQSRRGPTRRSGFHA